ncbi:MAG: FUSC family protein [Luteimonas sp.]|nr:FUSC family protein [Luteimonas sp.]
MFQLVDLSDSLSAQVATALVLFPMTLSGGREMAWTRVIGTWIGSLYALVLQLVLYVHSAHLSLLLPLYGAGLVLFASMHVRESAGPAVGFSAATAIAVMVGQLSPRADLYGVSLYRFSSVAISVFAMLLCIFVVQAALEKFPATRAGVA